MGDEGRLLDFCKKHILHGTPHVFHGRENEYFDFRSRIANHFSIGFHEVFIVGSAKLGFSPHKNKLFDLDSDIDVAIVSDSLFSQIMREIKSYQSQLRRSRASITDKELKQYHQFLEYTALGWIRPDKLPRSFNASTLRDNWFNFFKSISNGQSEVGNYWVAAGVYQSYPHLEDYQIEGLTDIYQALRVAI